MASIKCFESSCESEVEYTCNCTSPPTYSCENHFIKHCKLPNRAHTFESVYSQPLKETKKAILKFLEKEKCKQEKLKKKFLASFSQNLLNSKSSLKSHLQKLDSHSEEISTSLEKIVNVKRVEKEQDPFIALLTLQPEEAIEKAKSIISDKSASYSNAKLFCGFNEEIEKMIDVFMKDKFEALLDKKLENIENTLKEHYKMLKEEKKVDDDKLLEHQISEIEKRRKEFEDWKNEIELKRTNDINFLNFQLQTITEDLDKKISSLSERQLNNEHLISEIKIDKLKERSFSSPESVLKSNLSTQIYEEWNENSFLYSLAKVNDSKANLFTYDFETGKNERKKIIIKPLEYSNLNIVRLPNNELFCNFLTSYARSSSSDSYAFIYYEYKMFIIQRNSEIKYVQGHTQSPQLQSIASAYFDGSVYWFGVIYPDYTGARFDLEKNKWFQLIKKWPLSNPDAKKLSLCNCMAFNGNILIASNLKNLIRYSIEKNSYTIIPFEFTVDSIKILLNAERLYLIEAKGYVYESEIGQDNAWNNISESMIDKAIQIDISYYKGEAFISCGEDNYYKFNFNSKEITKL